MSGQLTAFALALAFTAALCGCDLASTSQRHVSAQWIPVARARLDVPGIELGKGAGAAVDILLPEVGSSGTEWSIGATRHSLEGSVEDAWNVWLRFGGRAVLDRGGSAFAYGAVGFSCDVVDSEDFSTFVTANLIWPPLPVGGYARAGLGLRIGSAILAAEAWASASRVTEDWKDSVWFTTVAYAFSLGATF